MKEGWSEKSVCIPGSRRLDFTSEVNGHRYSIAVGLPLEPPPEKGYRVLYVLDGYAYFASATEAVRVNGNAPGTVVVGIGYPDDREFIDCCLRAFTPLPPVFAAMPPVWAAITLQRFYDLSLPASDEMLASSRLEGLRSKHVGGLDAFLKTVEHEVKPRVSQLIPIDPSDQALFGHSLGGLAVLHALFVTPNSFRSFIAASPAIWWSDRAVLRDEAAFAAAVRIGSARPRVLITMGADEDVRPARAADLNPRERKQQSMVENARELTARLKSLPGHVPYEVEDYALFERQGHGVSPWPALGRAISFAFSAGAAA